MLLKVGQEVILVQFTLVDWLNVVEALLLVVDQDPRDEQNIDQDGDKFYHGGWLTGHLEVRCWISPCAYVVGKGMLARQEVPGEVNDETGHAYPQC